MTIPIKWTYCHVNGLVMLKKCCIFRVVVGGSVQIGMENKLKINPKRLGQVEYFSYIYYVNE